MNSKEEKMGLAGSIASAFVRSKITPLLVLGSLFLGLFSVWLLPREEEPQISVPMFDIMVPFPGAQAREVDERLASLGQRKLLEIPGVEYVYSTADANLAFFTVRFKVGFNQEQATTLLYSKVTANADFFPTGAGQPLIKPRSIDDVPVLALTFHGKDAGALDLRRFAASAREEISSIPDISETALIGGHKRQFLVRFEPEKLSARRLTPLQLAAVIGGSNRNLPAGRTEGSDKGILVETDSFIRSIGDLKSTIVGVWDGRPVRLGDVARVSDAQDEAQSDALFYGRAGEPEQAVTLTVAKRKGANATVVASNVLERLENLRPSAGQAGIEWTVTRNYGETAKEKSDELLFHMLLATVSVTVLIALALGIREALVVFVAVPVTLGLTLLVYYLFGYTLNRITLFALIFSIGILVDDAIVVVENIHRHCTLDPECPKWKAALRAVDEVGNPTILATLAVIAAILPMAFVSGMMGPYMMPIPVGASAAMLLSLAVAFIVSPWLFSLILHRWPGKHGHCKRPVQSVADRVYIALMKKLFSSRAAMFASLGVTAGLVLLSGWLFASRRVQAKMLPFDNKNEFQVILNMPEDSSYEQTRKAIDELARIARSIPETVNVQSYSGAAAPYNFNGLVRHYFLRGRPWQADLQVNLLPRHERKRQSHEIASAARPLFQEAAARYGARLQVAEVPPGPPVLATLVLEVYNEDDAARDALALDLKKLLAATPGIVDVDSYMPGPQPQATLAVDRQKATLNGISSDELVRTAYVALSGAEAGIAHASGEHESVDINLRLPAEERASLDWLKRVTLYSQAGVPLKLSELVKRTDGEAAPPVYRKNLQKTTYVTADVSGELESPVYAIAELRGKVEELAASKGIKIKQYYARQPDLGQGETALKWDGEWQVTYEVFRDMGVSFMVVLLLIYGLVVGWFGSFITPLIIMVPIPLTLIGVLPGHWLMGSFFTATSMIGFIAGAGIVVRNSIILVDFIELRLKEGASLEDACIDAGLARFRPMLLTAAAVVVAGAVILFDPIFQGLAISLIGGAIASTILSRTSVPALYWLANKNRLQGGRK
ncbi:MAG: efflux RND transporter permease subunit [Elusimicrobia bacterium]|nr:efflux RND transporter permease subunit [Elusimicrobiota bacterium]